MDGRLFTPFSMGVFASRLSGKSVFTKNLLLAQKEMIEKPFRKVIWIYKTWQEDLFKELTNRDFEIEFLDDLPNFDSMGKQENTVIVIDDFMAEASNSTQVQSLFTRGRHLGLSVIYLSQNLFHKGKHSRDLSLNMDYIVLFKNVRDATQISHLARQMYPNNSKFLISAYEQATREPYNHLFLDLKPNGNESLRVRGDILNKIQIIYLPKNL
jgi:hypothetical protein